MVGFEPKATTVTSDLSQETKPLAHQNMRQYDHKYVLFPTDVILVR